MRFPFCRNRDSVKNGILISIRRTGDGFHPGLFIDPKRYIGDIVMKNQIELLEQQVRELKREKEQLEKENIRLQKALNKKGKRLNFRHGYKNPRPHFCNRSTLTIHI